MSRWLTLFQAFLLIAATAAAQQSGRSSPSPDSKPTLMIIPHIHWEGAVFKTREEYLEMGLPYILEGLNLLKRYPEYRFVLDQTAYVKPFLERYPEQVDLFRRFLEEGRLQLAGGTVTMMDVNMPSGESYVRHMIYGKRYYRDELGHDPKVGWGLDTFGHHPQMPQLLKLAGYNSYWFQRGPAGQPLDRLLFHHHRLKLLHDLRIIHVVVCHFLGIFIAGTDSGHTLFHAFGIELDFIIVNHVPDQ